MKELNKVVIGDMIFKIIIKSPHVKFFWHKYRNAPIEKIGGANMDMSIVATTCIGGEILHILGRKFNTPFINNSMPRKHFITMACHFEDYMSAPYRLLRVPNRVGIFLQLEPVGLPAIRVRFNHDTDEAVVKENWNKRVKRINYNKLVFICDDKGLDESDYKKYDSVKAFKKIMLTSKEIGYPWAKILPSYAGMPCVGGYFDKDFYRGIWNFEKEWDYSEFLL